MTVNTFVGSYRQVTDQDRFATATRGRTLEQADYDADDFQVRASAERLFARARFEMGVDVNGRFNVHATDTVTNYALDGSVASEVFSESIEQARRNGTGAFASIEAALNPKATVAAGIRGDYVTSHNSGGYFGDHETSNGAALGQRVADRRALGRGVASSRRPAAGSVTPPFPIATIAGRPAGASSPAIPT